MKGDLVKQHTSSFLLLVQEAKKHIKETNVADVKAMMDNQKEFYLVDVREDREWENGHLPNAIHLGKGVIERDIERTIPDKESHIVLYCGGGFRSALATEAIQKMGYVHAISMDGGFKDWVESGYSVVND